MFMGEYDHTIDTKGRLIIPSKFREELGNEFMVTKGFEDCLFVFPTEEWKKLADQISVLPLTNTGARELSRKFIAGSAPCELDKQGRILIPSRAREYAHLEKDVVVAGMNNHIEIWNSSRYDETDSNSNVNDIAAYLAEIGYTI